MMMRSLTVERLSLKQVYLGSNPSASASYFNSAGLLHEPRSRMDFYHYTSFYRCVRSSDNTFYIPVLESGITLLAITS